MLCRTPPLSLICQHLMVFECDLFLPSNPFPKLQDADRYARQCPYAIVLHTPAEERFTIVRASPLFPDDNDIITGPEKPVDTITVDVH